MRENFTVKVTVTFADGTPAQGVRVSLDQRGGHWIDYYVATTDEVGVATVVCEPFSHETTASGVYDVTLYGSGVKWTTGELTIKKVGDQNTFERSFTVEKTPGYRSDRVLARIGQRLTAKRSEGFRQLTVYIREKGSDGLLKPLAGASVFVPGRGILTSDGDGNVEVRHDYPPGESISLVAELAGYQTAEGGFMVGVGSNALTSFEDKTVIVLEKLKAVEPLKLEVKVLDHDTDKALPHAMVSIVTLSRTLVDPVQADLLGVAEMELDLSKVGTVDIGTRTSLEGYTTSVSVIGSELLKGSDQPRLLTVYLTKLAGPLKIQFTVVDEGTEKPIPFVEVQPSRATPPLNGGSQVFIDSQRTNATRKADCEIDRAYLGGGDLAVRFMAQGYRSRSMPVKNGQITGGESPVRITVALKRIPVGAVTWVLDKAQANPGNIPLTNQGGGSTLTSVYDLNHFSYNLKTGEAKSWKFDVRFEEPPNEIYSDDPFILTITASAETDATEGALGWDVWYSSDGLTQEWSDEGLAWKPGSGRFLVGRASNGHFTDSVTRKIRFRVGRDGPQKIVIAEVSNAGDIAYFTYLKKKT